MGGKHVQRKEGRGALRMPSPSPSPSREPSPSLSPSSSLGPRAVHGGPFMKPPERGGLEAPSSSRRPISDLWGLPALGGCRDLSFMKPLHGGLPREEGDGGSPFMEAFMKPLHQARGAGGRGGPEPPLSRWRSPSPLWTSMKPSMKPPEPRRGRARGTGGADQLPALLDDPRDPEGEGADQLLGTERTSVPLQLRGRGSPPAPLSGAPTSAVRGPPPPLRENQRGGCSGGSVFPVRSPSIFPRSRPLSPCRTSREDSRS